MIWVNRYSTSIADTAKHNPVIVYHLITRRQLELSDSLKANKRTKINRAKFPFKAVKGFPNETKLYRVANQIYRRMDSKKVIAKGHVAAADDYSWSPGGMDTSMRYTFNLAMNFKVRMQARNWARNIGAGQWLVYTAK